MFSLSVMSDSLQHHGLWHTRLPCPSLSPSVCSNSCPLSQWCCLTISSSAAPFSSCPQAIPTWRSFSVNQLFTTGGQGIRASASASVLPINIEGWFFLRLTSLISLLSKGLSRVFSNSTIQKINSSAFSLLYGPTLISLTVVFLLSALWWQRRQWQPTPVLSPGKSHGWRSLVGCSPWGR